MCDTVRTRSYLPLLKQGDRDAQNDFCSEFFDCAYSNTWRNLDQHERTESVDDAFVKILAEARACILTDLTGGYVHRAVHLQCLLRWRKRKRRPSIVPLPEDIPDGSAPRADLEQILEETFVAARLTAEENQIVRLRVLEGATWDKVAETLAISVSTAQRRFNDALSKLRDWFKREFG